MDEPYKVSEIMKDLLYPLRIAVFDNQGNQLSEWQVPIPDEQGIVRVPILRDGPEPVMICEDREGSPVFIHPITTPVSHLPFQDDVDMGGFTP